MYSRKFNQSSIPPDYSGVSFRQREYEVPAPQHAREEQNESKAPRYPVEDRHCQIPPRKFKFKPSSTSAERKMQHTASTSNALPQERVKASSASSSLLSHSFTMEDIVLAGLILLLLNSECDNELLLVLGFLLLVGLQ